MHLFLNGKHFFAVSFLILLAWALSFLVVRYCHVKKQRILHLSHFFLIYIILIMDVQLYDVYLNYKLNSFDIDHDTFFSFAEQNEEQKKYFDLVINDSGRNLVLIWGAFFSIISTATLYSVISIINIFRNYINKRIQK
jgi:hypothetical protein